ncbi:MAG: serine/threonine protein kinase, partial [Trebonia sp.]
VAGTVLGTVHYVSPEQIQDRTVLGSADQYSLGCVLYECLTGRVPFEKQSSEAIMWAHVHDFPAPASLLRPELPAAIDEVFARVLAKHPEERYADCREFIAAAREALVRVPGLPPGRRSPTTGTRVNFQPAPVPARGSSVPSRGVGEADRGVVAPREPTVSAFEAAERPGAGAARRPFSAGGGERAGGVRRGGGTRRGRGGSPGRRTVLGLAAIAIMAAGGTAAGMLASQAGNGSIGLHQAAESTPPPASALFSALGRAERFTGMLRMSACAQTTATLVQCTNPDPAIASVTFATYSSRSALYSKYEEIVGNLTDRPFAADENTHVCDSTAPDPTGESTWNHSDQYFTKYSVGQLASGSVSTDTAMGRVFCVQKPNGSAVMVWTQDSGDLLGYATGAEASHEQVWNWFYDVHHNIIFPGQPAMTMSPTATSS